MITSRQKRGESKAPLGVLLFVLGTLAVMVSIPILVSAQNDQPPQATSSEQNEQSRENLEGGEQVQRQQTNGQISGNFVLSPAKVEVTMAPGETVTRELAVTNRTDRELTFNVQLEDFRGSDEPGETVVLLGKKEGPYSLKDFLTPALEQFTLASGEQITFPVEIAVPADAEPGGLYGSVLVKNAPGEVESGAQTISRLGALFFVRVSGEVNESGELQEFDLSGPDKLFYQSGPFTFRWLYENTGSVHLNPYGGITITNTFGSIVDEIEVQPYFALPGALRSRQISWDPNVLLGRYTATLELNRGYDNVIDRKQVVFWVIPWKVLGGALAVIFVLFLLIYFIRTRVQISFKKKGE